MNNNYISRRKFVNRLSTGALSLGLIPLMGNNNDYFTGCTAKTIHKKDTNTSLPPFFDCNKYIGPGFPHEPDFPTASQLLKHMDRLGIDRSVAWHTNACDFNPMDGNRLLITEINSDAAAGRIIPSFIITPTLADNTAMMDDLLQLSKKHDIHAFHFFLNKPVTREKFG